jgi:hypothetical protein
MSYFLTILLALVLPAYAPPSAPTEQGAALSAVVEQALMNVEPDWQLVEKQTVSNDPRGGVHNPHLEQDGATLTWKRGGRKVLVMAYKFKELEWARHVFNVSTITPIMRRGYKLSKEGEELRKLVACGEESFSCAGFLTNRSGNGYVESYDAVFIRGRTVIIVTARKPEVAQRFALHIAQALRAT